MHLKDPIIELKSTNFWIYLKEIDDDYANKALTFLNQISPLLTTIKDHFPYYTRHDAHHGFQVLKRMSEILHPDCLKNNSELSFSAEEVFLLICSAYGHDLGMTVFPDEKKSLLKELNIIENEEWKTNPTLQNYLRKEHSTRGGLFINENFDTIGLPKSLVSHLDKLMAAHNLSINELDTKLGRRYAAGAKEIDLKQLACVLCIADSLEFSDTRVIDGVLKILEEKIKDKEDKAILTSYYENMKHVCIGDNVAISKKDGKIIFSGTFTNPDIQNLAHQTIDLVESWVRDYCDIDYNSITKRLQIRTDSIERTLDSNYDFIRIGIRIKKENIIGLLSSNATWLNDPALVIRELLQNSVEACRYRKFNSSKADKYEPKIEVFFDKQNREITISDNGCGMSRNTILNNFLTVGNSRSFDPTYSAENYSSLARFGIGFWSVFTISDRAKIKTGPFEYLRNQTSIDTSVTCLEFDVAINEFRDYTVFKQTKDKPGTSITLQLKNKIRINDIPSKLDYHIACSDIPITIKTGSELYQIPKILKIPTVQDFFGVKEQLAKIENIKVFKFESLENELEFKLFIFYRQEKNASFLLTDGKRSVLQLYIDSHTHYSRISICGFQANFIGKRSCFDIDRVGGFMADKKDPGGISFTLNRNAILSSPKGDELNDCINIKIHEAYRNFLIETNSYYTQSIYNLNHQSRMHGGNSGSFNYDLNNLQFFYTKFPELICFKFYKIEQGKSINECEIIYANLNTIRQLSITVLTIHSDLRFHNDPDINFPLTYRYITSMGTFNNMYLQEKCTEEGIIINYCKTSFIKVISMPNIKLNFCVSKTNDIDFDVENSHFFGTIQGMSWAGQIYEKKIEGENFIFSGMQLLIVNKNSEISTVIKQMYNDDEYHKLCKLIKLLYQSTQGFIDESIKKYLI